MPSWDSASNAFSSARSRSSADSTLFGCWEAGASGVLGSREERGAYDAAPTDAEAGATVGGSAA